MALRWQCLCIDAVDPTSPAAWWAELLGWRITDHDEDSVVVEPPQGSAEDGVSPDLLFLQVPEPKTVKDRLHIDLRPEYQAAEVERAEALGARRVDIGHGSDTSWVVLADPEGNEFCILRALTPKELAEDQAS